MDDATADAGLLGGALEGEDVVRAGALHLDRLVVAVVLLHAEDGLVEAQRSLGISHRQRDVREAVRLDHACAASFCVCTIMRAFATSAIRLMTRRGSVNRFRFGAISLA